MPENNDAWFQGMQLKERELSKIFENIKEELALITANAKLNYAMRKTSEKTLKSYPPTSKTQQNLSTY